MKNKDLNILFIGNSHTYFNDLPRKVADLFGEGGTDCEVTMLAHGGWYLKQHVKEPEVSFNIRCGSYDYVVLQEHSHPFDDVPGYQEAAAVLCDAIKKAGSRPVLYGTWSREDQPGVQEYMNSVNRKLARELDMLYAGVGEGWWSYQTAHLEETMYAPDGAHASDAGSSFAARMIWETIREDWEDDE